MVIPPLPWRFDTCKVQPPSPPKPKSQNVKSKKEKEKKVEKNRNKSEKAQIRTFSPHPFRANVQHIKNYSLDVSHSGSQQMHHVFSIVVIIL